MITVYRVVKYNFLIIERKSVTASPACTIYNAIDRRRELKNFDTSYVRNRDIRVICLEGYGGEKGERGDLEERRGRRAARQ